MIASFGGEQPQGIAMGFPVNAKHFKCLGNQRDEAVLVSLTASHVDQHPAGVDVGDLQVKCLFQPQSQRIDGPEKAFQTGLANRVDQLIDFGDGQDRGQFELLGHAEFGQRGPVPGAGVAVEEFQSGVGDLERIGLPLLIVFDEQQIASEVVFGGLVGRLIDPLCELADLAEVGLVGPFFQAGQLQVL